MKTRLSEVLRNVLDVAVVVSALVVATLVVRGYIRSTRVPATAKIVGQKIQVPGVAWDRNKRTVVFVMQRNCVYCEQSIPFYKRLISAGSSKTLHFIAVMPDPPELALRYIQERQIGVEEVRTSDLEEIGISGTPTILEVNERGIIINAWRGLLSGDEASGVYLKLGLQEVGRVGTDSETKESSASDLVSARQLREISARIYIVDVRAREQYARAHIVGSKNIPLDEIETRAIHEVPRGGETVIYCEKCTECEALAEKRGSQTRCKTAVWALRQLGFTRFRLLRDNLATVEAAGFGIEGETYFSDWSKQPGALAGVSIVR